MRDWVLTFEGYDPEEVGLREALTTLGNGYLATRGAAPEAVADEINYPGTYIAGLYNRLVSDVSGRAVENDCIVNVPNWLPLTFRPQDGGWVDVDGMEVAEHQLELDLKRGQLTRRFVVVDEAGRRTRVSQRRFVSQAHPHLAGQEVTFVAENWSGRVEFRSALDGTVENTGVKRYQELNNDNLAAVGTGFFGEDGMYLEVETNQSNIRIAQAARTLVFRNGRYLPAVEREEVSEPEYVAQDFSLHVAEGDEMTIQKVVAVYTGRDRGISEALESARTAVERAGRFENLLAAHVLAWDHLWRRTHLDLDSEQTEALLVLRFHVFHLLQVCSEHVRDLDAGVPARGLHGEAYRGHVFWDELFIFPFLTFSLPEVTRSLLAYRWRRLDEARWSARKAGFEGAMFPWQSSSDGREETQTMHLNPKSGRWLPDHSHLQRHVNSAIAYNVWEYYQVTADQDFLIEHGAEMILEIARFWASVATFNRLTHRYEILGVVGPDEYHEGYPDRDEPGLDNNAYTNVMAVWVLLRALDVLDTLPEPYRGELIERIGLMPAEVELWEDITCHMFVPFHDEGIISQFSGYEDLAELDWEGYRERYGNIQRLDRILEAEGDSPNNYKLSKQADTLMLYYLLSEEELRELLERLGYELSDAALRRTINYYCDRTSHGSTLSNVVHSWIHSRLDRRRSWQLFVEALRSDLYDVQGGTTKEGIHLGAMAGTVDLVQRCWPGLEARGEVLYINPLLPDELPHLGFNLRYRGHWLGVQITDGTVRIESQPTVAEPITVAHGDESAVLQPGDSVTFTPDGAEVVPISSMTAGA
ncbi:MAG: putative glycosyl hydrolase [Acidimicrobiales bacterium]|nr:MAG: glycoside hydrolase family 65 protein [Actinomycetota bacterium]MBV6506994.1 putative glycosyl hydrolase [Acidimicrobiales bacterium]RIK05806.1 MAG: trehalose 6-phosphate phosphorylase [Acidobacteriota bacterium]